MVARSVARMSTVAVLQGTREGALGARAKVAAVKLGRFVVAWWRALARLHAGRWCRSTTVSAGNQDELMPTGACYGV